ncbi:MAG: Rrf2 family transcriptional regulator [Candidatus Brocadiales bacterium]
MENCIISTSSIEFVIKSKKPMKLSKKTDYALRALLHLSLKYGKGSVQIKEISSTERLPNKFLENILLSLRKAGILQSRMGLKGGYSLARPPEKITLGEVVRILDGTIAPMGCVSRAEYESCPEEEIGCAIKSVMQDVRDAVARVLDDTTLADLARRVGSLQKAG